jgi:hypothetical protein
VELFSLYERTSSAAGRWAVRRIVVADDGLRPGEWEEFQSLQEARGALARRGHTRVPRGAQDEPELLETWL